MDWIYPILRTWLHIAFGLCALGIIVVVLSWIIEMYYEIADRRDKIMKLRAEQEQLNQISDEIVKGCAETREMIASGESE